MTKTLKVVSDFEPAGSQPEAINNLVSGLEDGLLHQTLLGVIARSTEAKKMGIAMGVPWFKVRESFLKQNGKVFSSNYKYFL